MINVKETPIIKVKHRFFENSFCPATVTEWNDFISLSPNEAFDIYNPHDLKLSTRLRLDLSHLRGRKCNHNFSDCPGEICMCGKDIESTNNFLLQCSLFFKERQVLMNKIRDIDSSLIDQNETLPVMHFFLVKKT